MKPDALTKAELVEVLDGFCAGFADRDAEAVMRLFGRDPDVVVVTSEEFVLRGTVALKRFLDRYVTGGATYSWKWDRCDVSTAGTVAWLLAEGTETAATERAREHHAYRMTMVLERHEDRWLLVHIHGSTPHLS